MTSKCQALRADTPFLDESKTPTEKEEEVGALQPIASKVLMKILYAAHMARYDLFRATCALACMVTKWTRDCDRRLHRLVCSINTTLDVTMIGWVGDSPKDLSLRLYSDADLAGDAKTSRSTSGVFPSLPVRV